MAASIDESYFEENRLQAVFDAHCELKDGYPYPDWMALHEEAKRFTAESDLTRYWEGMTDAWLTRMQERMGDRCDYRASKNFKLLWTDEAIDGTQLLATAEEILSDLSIRLAGIARTEGYGSLVIFLFDDHEQYYTYTGEFCGDRDMVPSGGMMVCAGYSHIVLPPHSTWSVESTLLHEIVHACVVHLPLPLWVNEALAMLVEWGRLGRNRFEVGPDVVEEHSNYWDGEKIRQFWTGESFHNDYLSQKLSYELADILRRLIVSDFAKDSKDFVNFVNDAKWEDAGEASARRHLGVGLGEIAGRFLGTGDWAPLREGAN